MGVSKMRNTWLIAKREYLERVKAKSFLIMTILVPALMGGIAFSSVMVNGRRNSASHMAIVTSDAQFGLDLQTELTDGGKSKDTVDILSKRDDETRKELNQELKDKDLDGYLWVTPAEEGAVRPRFEWVPKSKADIVTKSVVSSAIRRALTREKLTHSGMGSTDVDAMMQPVELESGEAGKNDSSTAAFASAYALFFLMYFVIVLYGMNVARSIIEEKTSRIFEVLLATIKPEEMMAGKILGVGSVGLTQVAIWITAAVVALKAGVFGSGITLALTGTQVFFFVLFFLLGYILYSSVAAALGAMCGSEQELQQMNIFLMLPLIACSTIVFGVVTNPHSFIAKLFSFIPFCTPLIMYVRIAVERPPWWQIGVSVADMLITIYCVLWLTTRIYRVGILMYGKRPNLPEILRWLKYS